MIYIFIIVWYKRFCYSGR